ncbi:5566_t:CDS:2 [Paraglomus occultum]|uniref:5566_t:CDS:1 n=1 Tax=Paraglomus occultum TaxID=144539 RepID=A0A9N8W940_9GLOM|nr:5566_t:CDS:2 [Paraglomus occultum]
MSKLTSTPPLVDLNPAKSVHEVEIHLHEPLIQRPGSRKKRIGFQILNALARLEILLTKEEALASAVDSVKFLDQQRYNHSEIESVISVIQKSLVQFDEDGLLKKDTQAYMSELGLAAFFPKSSKRLVVSMMGSTNEFRAHLHEMTIVNQLVSMALQLQQDINLTNHKYMAHQLALLYQCLNQASEPFLKYKSRVEIHFDAIKTLTNSSDEPVLTKDHKEWLSQLTADIVTEALFSGRSVSTASRPLATYLTALDQTAAHQ